MDSKEKKNTQRSSHRVYVISGGSRGVNKTLALLGCYSA